MPTSWVSFLMFLPLNDLLVLLLEDDPLEADAVFLVTAVDFFFLSVRGEVRGDALGVNFLEPKDLLGVEGTAAFVVVVVVLCGFSLSVFADFLPPSLLWKRSLREPFLDKEPSLSESFVSTPTSGLRRAISDRR